MGFGATGALCKEDLLRLGSDGSFFVYSII